MRKKFYVNILKEYGLSYKKLTHREVTSRLGDYRETLVFDQQWVLRINSLTAMTEERISELNQLIERYRSFGVYAPSFRKTLRGNYIVTAKDKIYYLTEYADYTLASNTQMDRKTIFYQKIEHLGRFASRYTNQELMQTRSMWSILDLAPLDKDVDEKQENCNALISSLREISEEPLAKRIEEFNQKNRDEIQKVFQELPRCVFQGDLNDSNILMKEGEFFGLIDFNMAGTEVNINCFLSEIAPELEEEDLVHLSASEILSKMILEWDEALKVIFKNYSLTPVEQKVFENYRNLILISQYPYVCAYTFYLKGEYRAKVLELLNLIIGREES